MMSRISSIERRDHTFLTSVIPLHSLVCLLGKHLPDIFFTRMFPSHQIHN